MPETGLNLSDQFPYVLAAIPGRDTAEAGGNPEKRIAKGSHMMQPATALHGDFDRHERRAEPARPQSLLTPTQMQVLRCVRSGLLNKQIAHELGIAEATVKVHMTALMRKLNVRNRTQAAIAAGQFQLVE
jgi:DNA-binding NarL/FixJ family response regulator